MVLSVNEAHELISDVRRYEISLGRDPKTWYTYHNHVYGTAIISERIAHYLPDMDSEKIYICALLHDISRIEENQLHRFHGILGYEKLLNLDEQAARTALTHMFIHNELPSFQECEHLFFGNKKDYDFVSDFIASTPPNDTDFLIQLTDGLANKNGLVTIEGRMEEVMKRRNNDMLIYNFIQKRHQLKTYFEAKIGRDIYALYKECPYTVNEYNEIQFERS